MKSVKLVGSIIAIVFVYTFSAYGQTYTTTPTYGGGSRTTGPSGTYTTTPTYGGGSRMTGPGRTCTTTPTFGGGSRTTCY